VIRPVVFIAMLLVASSSYAESKVSGGGTPRDDRSPAARTAPPDKAATSTPGRSEAAKKALDALKDKKGGKDGDRKGGR